MDERDYRRRIETKKRIIPKSELREGNHNNEDFYEIERTKEKPKRRKYGCFAGTVVGLAMLIFTFAFCLLFYVQEVEVVGNEYSASSEIVDWLSEDIFCKNSISMYVKYNYIEAELPMQVSQMSVEILSPWTVRVESIDKTLVGGFVLEDYYVYCDIDGIVILESLEKIEGLPLVEGVVVEEYTLYEVVPIDDIDVLKNALEVMNILNIEGIDFDTISSSGSGAEVEVTIGGILIELGEDNYQEKIMQITPILENLDEEGTLDLKNYSSSNTTISFKQKNTEN